MLGFDYDLLLLVNMLFSYLIFFFAVDHLHITPLRRNDYNDMMCCKWPDVFSFNSSS